MIESLKRVQSYIDSARTLIYGFLNSNSPIHAYSWDSSVGKATGYVLDGRGIEILLSAGANDFSLLHSIQSDSGVHPASYKVVTGGSFPGGKAATAWT
jgi:hypothetical protein